jgi:HSP20 family molecular chaperone IbpA
MDGERSPNRPVLVPPADIYETGDSIFVPCEMRAVRSNAVDITLERRVLTIRPRTHRSHPHPHLPKAAPTKARIIQLKSG